MQLQTRYAVAALALLVPDALALLRFSCSQLVVERLDPLVNPGVTGSPHLHQIIGGVRPSPSEPTCVKGVAVIYVGTNSLLTECLQTLDGPVYGRYPVASDMHHVYFRGGFLQLLGSVYIAISRPVTTISLTSFI